MEEFESLTTPAVPLVGDSPPSNKVRIQRWASAVQPLVGPSLIMLDKHKAAESLADSGFMRPWVVKKILEHLESGGSFTNRGASKQDSEPAIVSNGEQLFVVPRSEYRMASKKEELDWADNLNFEETTGRSSARVRDRGYVLHYHEGADVLAAYDTLPNQARAILDILHESGRTEFTEASIGILLAAGKDRLKTKQDVMTVFGFYRRRLINEGHFEEVDVG